MYLSQLMRFYNRLHPAIENIERHHRGIREALESLAIASPVFYEQKARQADPRPLPARARRDVVLCDDIQRVYAVNFQVYGARKVWRQLGREDIVVARCTGERLMRKLGVVRGRRCRTTIADDEPLARFLPVRIAIVEVALTDGSHFTERVKPLRGTQCNPMSRAEAVDKSKDLIAPVLGPETCTRLIAMVLEIEAMTDSQVAAVPATWLNHGDTAFTAPMVDQFMKRIMPVIPGDRTQKAS